MPDERHGLPIEQFEELDSTSLEARRRIDAGLAGPRGFLARRQTGGYGRRGRSWHSPDGGLWLTIAWPADNLDRRALGLRVGAAVGRVIETALHERGGSAASTRLRIKWPNDLLIGEKKVCGTLCESISAAMGPARPWLLVGVGVNVNNRAGALPEGLRRPATSLAEEVHQAIDVPTLAMDIAASLGRTLAAELRMDDLQWCATRLWKLDQSAAFTEPSGSVIRGVLRGLSSQGTPMIEADGGRIEVSPGAEMIDA